MGEIMSDDTHVLSLRVMSEILGIFVPVEAYGGPKACTLKFDPANSIVDALVLVDKMKNDGWIFFLSEDKDVITAEFDMPKKSEDDMITPCAIEKGPTRAIAIVKAALDANKQVKLQ